MDDKAIFAKNLRALTRKAGKTQVDLVNDLEFNKSTVSTWFNGIKMPRMGTIQTLADYFGVRKSALIENDDSVSNIDSTYMPITTRQVPLVGAIHCGELSYAEQEFDSYVELGSEVKCDFALRCKGDSMIGARIFDGDVVFIRKQPSVNDGEIAAVLIDDEAALKRVRFLPNNMVLLLAENPKYEAIIIDPADETQRFSVLGKAVAFQSDVI